LSVGERNDGKWDAYRSDLAGPILQWSDLQHNACMIDQGAHGLVYLVNFKGEKFVVKKFKLSNPRWVQREALILDKLSVLWPQYFQAFVIERENLVGFAMGYFDGKKLDRVLQDKESVFNKSKSARVQLVKKLADKISQIQDLGVCHGDISLANVMVKHTVVVQNRAVKKSFFQKLINFGNIIVIICFKFCIYDIIFH
jgi:serine/threonine protein kinase